jgi:hypothetical protein
MKTKALEAWSKKQLMKKSLDPNYWQSTDQEDGLNEQLGTDHPKMKDWKDVNDSRIKSILTGSANCSLGNKVLCFRYSQIACPSITPSSVYSWRLSLLPPLAVKHYAIWKVILAIIHLD